MNYFNKDKKKGRRPIVLGVPGSNLESLFFIFIHFE